MTTRTDRPVARFTAAGDIVQAIPHLCGFVPTESLFVMSLREPRGRVGVTMRFDLPPPGHERALGAAAAERLTTDRADRTFAVVYSEAPDGPGGQPHRRLVRALRDSCARRGIRVDDVLLVRAGRWTSYVCRDPHCCPPEGTALGTTPAPPALGLLAAEHAAQGRVVLGSRAELQASLTAPSGAASSACLRELQSADRRWTAARADRGRQAVVAEAVQDFRVTLRRYTDPPAELSAEQTAALTVALEDVLVRDTVMTWALHEADPLLMLLRDLARAAVAPYDAPVCTLLAWVAYGQGNGGLANVALERVASSRPDYSLAVLLSQALHAQIPPEQVRALLRETRAELRRRRRSPR